MWIFPGTYTENSMTVNGINITGIDGASATIIQAAASPNTVGSRIFTTNNTVTLNGLTLQNGGTTLAPMNGGAILNTGSSLTINSCIISNNQSVNFGGGVYNAAPNTLEINFSTISSNISTAGGGLYSAGISLTVNFSTISNNTANQGAGVDTSQGINTFNNSTISDNSASGAVSSGGGILVSNAGTTFIMNNCTVSGNTSTVRGGGIVASNSVITLNYSTVAGNSAGIAGGGIWSFLTGTVTLMSTIVAGNDVAGNFSDPDADCFNTPPASLGYNLSGIGTGCALSGTGDINVAPATVYTTVIGPLQNNGGPTETHALLVASPAIDQIPAATNSCGISPFDEDQRTDIRPFNIQCDIGSYEAQ
jgi:hypothetical protein